MYWQFYRNLSIFPWILNSNFRLRKLKNYKFIPSNCHQYWSNDRGNSAKFTVWLICFPANWSSITSGQSVYKQPEHAFLNLAGMCSGYAGYVIPKRRAGLSNRPDTTNRRFSIKFKCSFSVFKNCSKANSSFGLQSIDQLNFDLQFNIRLWFCEYLAKFYTTHCRKYQLNKVCTQRK